MPELLKMFGKSATPEAIRKALELEVLQMEGLRVRARVRIIHSRRRAIGADGHSAH